MRTTAKILAKLYLDNDRTEDARKLLDKATPLAPDDRGLWDLRVSAAANIDEEERLYRAMVKQFPADGKYAVALAAVLVRRDEQAEAQKVLTPLLNDDQPASVRAAAHYQMARSLFKQKDAAGAVKQLQSALITDSSSLAIDGSLAIQGARPREARANQGSDPDPARRPRCRPQCPRCPGVHRSARIESRLEGRRPGASAPLHGGGGEGFVERGQGGRSAPGNEPPATTPSIWRAGPASSASRPRRSASSVWCAWPSTITPRPAFHLERCDLDAKALAGLIEAQVRTGDLDAARRRAESIKAMDNAGKDLFAQEKDVARLVERRDHLLAQWKIDKEQEVSASRIVSRYVSAERGLAERWPHAQIEKLVESAAADKLEYGPMLAVRGWLLLEKGQVRKAIADADAAIKLQPSDARAFLVRGRARLEQANVKQALSDLRKATELSRREDAIVLHWLAAALLDAGRAKEAVETQRLALLLRPTDVELQDQLRRMEKMQESGIRGQESGR